MTVVSLFALVNAGQQHVFLLYECLMVVLFFLTNIIAGGRVLSHLFRKGSLIFWRRPN